MVGVNKAMADEDMDGLLSQDDINAALQAAGLESEAGSSAEVAPEPTKEETGGLSQADIDAALNAAQGVGSVASEARVDATGRPFDEAAAAMAAAIAQETAQAASATPKPLPPGSRPIELPEIGGESITSRESQAIDLLRDVDLTVKIELGRSRMLVDDVLRLGEGSVVELDKLAGDPVDVLVNNRLVARGEVLVLNDNFCVRINDIVNREGEEDEEEE